MMARITDYSLNIFGCSEFIVVAFLLLNLSTNYYYYRAKKKHFSSKQNDRHRQLTN